MISFHQFCMSSKKSYFAARVRCMLIGWIVLIGCVIFLKKSTECDYSHTLVHIIKSSTECDYSHNLIATPPCGQQTPGEMTKILMENKQWFPLFIKKFVLVWMETQIKWKIWNAIEIEFQSRKAKFWCTLQKLTITFLLGCLPRNWDRSHFIAKHLYSKKCVHLFSL